MSSPEATSHSYVSSPGQKAIQSVHTYRSGESVPEAGTYWVRHAKHRPAHAAKVRFQVFPACAQCGDNVRFQLAEDTKPVVADWLRRDPDFKEALELDRKRNRKRSSRE